MEPDGYFETNVEPLPSPRAGETRSFQAFAEGASLTVSLEHRRPQLNVTTAASLRLTDTTITARQVSLATTDRGNQFVLDLASPREWVIDSIETMPAEAMDSLTTTGTRRKLHRLRLRQPVRSDNPVRVVVQAHRRTPPGRCTSVQSRFTPRSSSRASKTNNALCR